MKKTYFSLIALLCGMLQVGCTCEELPAEQTGKEGTFTLSLNAEDILTDVTTRGTVDVSSFKVNLKDKNNIALFEGKAFNQLSDADRTLPASTGYQISVESCTQAEATTANDGWGAMRFTGNATFDIVSDQSTPVKVECTMGNAGLQIIFDALFTAKFPIYAATTQDDRALVFKQANPEAIAFYDAESENTSVTLKITGSKGGWEDRINVEKQIALTKGKITLLTISYDENSGYVDIEFETNTGTETDDSNDVTIQ